MAKRGARSKPSPEPYVPIPDDDLQGELCMLCGDPIEPWPAEWCELISPGDRLAGWAHATCIADYNLFAAQMPFAAALQTPLL
jgi:hypothetical protein